MAVLVDTLYGEKCCNKDIGKISYKICKQCEFKVSLSKTFVTCHLDTNKNKGEITMAKIKSYTDLEQSKKLAEILPLESADMCYLKREINDTFIETPIIKSIGSVEKSLCCWSLAALLEVLPRIDIEKEICTDDTYDYRVKAYIGDGYIGDWYDNPIDCCYEMILKLHELKIRRS